MKSKWIPLVAFLTACAAPVAPERPDAAFAPGGDLAGVGDDLAQPAGGDLSTGSRDLATGSADLASPGVNDLAVANDLAMPNDLTPPADLQPVLDLTSSATDLASSDLAMCKPPTGSTCNTYPQCGCPAQQTCSVIDYTSGSSSCVLAGNTPNFSVCTTANECVAGATCGTGVCQPYCRVKGDCAAANGSYSDCIQLINPSNNNKPIPNETVCTRTCDPVDPSRSTGGFDPCGAGATCVPDASRASDCLAPSTSTGTQGVSCTASTGLPPPPDLTKCAPGFDCVGDPNNLFAYLCAKFCHVGSNADCTGSAAGKTCRPYSTKQYAGPLEIGACG